MRTLLILMTIVSLSLTNAQAKIGWTYEQCVAHWGHETDRILLQKPDNEDDPNSKYKIIPLFIFHYGHRYICVEFTHQDIGDDSDKCRVIKEHITNRSGF